MANRALTAITAAIASGANAAASGNNAAAYGDGARATALMKGHDAVMPHHVKAVAQDVLRHRVLMTYYADAEGVTSEQVVDEILGKVKVP